MAPKSIFSSQPFVNALNVNYVNGLLTFDLSQACNIISNGQVAPARVFVKLNASAVCPSTPIWFNDQLNPAGTSYLMQLFDSGGNFQANFGQVVLSGTSPLDLSLIIPTSAGVSFSAAVLQQPTVPQVINGQTLTMEGAPLGFSGAGVTTPDTGISRTAAGTLVIGNGTQGNISGMLITGSAGGGSSAGLQVIGATAAAVGIRDISQGTDNKQWDVATTAGQFLIRAVNDANSATSNAFLATRSGSTVTGTSLAAPLTVTSIQGPGFQKQVFAGNGTFTIPAGITQVKVTVVGGGGAGGGTGGTNASTGGGSGSCSIKWLTGLTPANTLAVVVGTGGTGVSNASGNSGVNSTVSSGTQTISTITGGGASGGSANGSGGGQAGTGGGGDLNFNGNTGFPPIASNGGVGAASIFGGGAAFTVGTVGNAGGAPGAGGSGCGSGGGAQAGGAGANGLVVFEWVS